MRSSQQVLDEGTPLVLTSAGDVETLVRAHGTHFIVTNRNGDVTPAGARELGLLADDTRHLSYYALSLRGRPNVQAGRAGNADELVLVHLSASAFDAAENRVDLMVSGLGDDEFLDDPQNYLHIRRRQAVDAVFREQIEVVNYLQKRVDLELALDFAADFADVFEIRGAKRSRRGTAQPPIVSDTSVDVSYDGVDGKTYVTRLSFSPPPTRLTAERATFVLSLEAGGATSIDVCIAPTTAPRVCRGGHEYETRVRAAREEAERFIEECTRFHCDNLVIQNVIEQSTKDLRALSIAMRGEQVLAAGIPWFCCPFGRDTVLSAYEALTVNPELARTSLRALAAWQGKTFDEFTEEEPGKIFHELRFGEMAASGEIPQRPYYGTIDATPLFVIVAHATYEVTGDTTLLSELKAPVLAALAWIDRRSDQGARPVAYERRSPRGLDNQGWKDSRNGVSFPDGRRATPPIALVEVQGYCVDAYRRGAELLAAMGESDHARAYEERYRRMSAMVDSAFWLPELGRYAFALDGNGEPLPTIVSNVGHLLWSRVPSLGRARATAQLLVSPESLSEFGIRTLAAGQPVYNPLSYHNGTIWPHDNALIAKGFANYDLMDQACSVFEALVAAMGQFTSRRLPELYCGTTHDRMLVRYPVACSPQAWAAAAPFLLLQAVLGIDIDGPGQRLLVRNPKMPASMNHVEIDRLRVGRSRVSLRLHRVGKRCHVDRLDVTGAPLRTFVEIE